MNTSDEKKYEITTKLEKEQTNVALLKDHLRKSSQIRKGIDSILNTFEERLSRLEDTILPVYNDTENLQKSQQNIDRTLQLLDSVISYYNVSSEVETIIEKGPGEGNDNLDEYLNSLNRLAKAQKYFEKHIPQSVELDNVSTLFHKGSDKLNAEFKMVLDKHNTPMLPVALLDLINPDETSSKEVKSLPVQIPDHNKEVLIKIANWLLNSGRDEYLTVYGKVRGAVLQRSLTMLRNHQKSVSGGSVHGVASSPMPRQKTRSEAARRPSTRRLQQVFERQANKMLMKANLGPRRSSSHLDTSYNGEEFDNEQEMDNYLFCILALHKLMQIEQALIKGIIPPAHQPRVFEIIVRDAMDTIVQDGENIVARAKKCLSRHDFGTVLVVFPILKQFRILKPEFERTVEEYHNVKLKFDSIFGMLHSTGTRALEDFIESLRSDLVAQLPTDGTVHEVTSNVIMFLEQLLDYVDTIGIVLEQDPSYLRHLDALKGVTDRNKALLGIYIKKVLVQLNQILLSKSEQYNDLALKAIFRLNNNNYVLRSLQRNNLLELYLIPEPKCEEYYHNSIQTNKVAFSQSWNKLLNYIDCEDGSMSVLHGDKLRDRDRAMIKEKFAGFNKEIDDIAKVQRRYSIPDVELRESIKRDNKELVIPKYNAFYNMYAGVNFTKNPDKYIKHKPEEVSAIIDRFFDVAA